MLTIRPYRNEDLIGLLEIWQTNCGPDQTRFMPMLIDDLETGPLGLPFFDRRLLQMAFHNDRPVGFAHAGFGPNETGSDISSEVGQIALVVVVPDCPDTVGVCEELIRACETVLKTSGVREIIGGSPCPSLPFYVGLYGGAEPIGIFDADAAVTGAFHRLGYTVRKKTLRFERDLTNLKLPTLPSGLHWRNKIRLEIKDFPSAQNWWDALSLVRGEWIESTAVLEEGQTKIARIRIRLNYPRADKTERMFRSGWDAALMNIRVHPKYHRQGLGTFVLGETLRFLSKERRAVRIEAHVADGCSQLYGLLRTLGWREVETGTIFGKEVR